MPITLALTHGKAPNGPFIGACYYIEKYHDDFYAHPAHITAEVEVPEEEFTELMTLARLGRYASKIGLSATGMKYGLVPDGSDKEWGTADESKRKVAVTHVDFSFPLAGAAVEEAAEESGNQREKPITAEILRSFDARLSAIRTATGWTAVLLVAIVVLMVWRGH